MRFRFPPSKVIPMRAFLITVLTVSGATHAAAATVDSFDDLEFFVGSGANTAAFVVDWRDGLDPLAWGYRFDGPATGEDMLRAVVAADPSFFARIGTAGSFGIPLYGLGYDRDGDGFGIDDGTPFPGGLAVTGIPDGDFLDDDAPADADDSYEEGFFTGFFAYLNGVGEPFDGGTWTVAGTGVSGRTLVDGAYDALVWDPAFLAFTGDGSGAFPDQPVAAAAPSAVVPEPSTLLLAGLGTAGLGLIRRRRR